ncbi:exodeoxyribonuclease VII small subunit [Candidatus Hydrogenosomobacter endosymbioticus]|uniref:Exodeoxyribonuclease 7 small subunit n=1 Tax=Candidatus Hydrogenosomobacter endosymbioticus TaxID=2558174 RepID=A0ABM7V979_9PROT|nr:exodeoxyribonuclease VII small subunit [Candidatus Hydrogenosomobacter endosymbioticus]BDB96324.1 exodeoxyribonuclease 7 small subunit [Candidatus Hydrogenosomobacter endosymbioticus]
MSVEKESSNKLDDISCLSFDKALEELEKIARMLEDGKIPLEDAIKAYERGAELNRHCQKKLLDAQMIIEKITKDGIGVGESG